MRPTVLRSGLLVVLLLSLSACSSAVRKPRLLHPGPTGYQRYNAEQFDPYPINDLGPEIVGGRPREFQKPRDEIARSRQFLPFGPWQAPPPAPAVVPGAVVAPPPVPVIGPRY